VFESFESNASGENITSLVLLREAYSYLRSWWRWSVMRR